MENQHLPVVAGEVNSWRSVIKANFRQMTWNIQATDKAWKTLFHSLMYSILKLGSWLGITAPMFSLNCTQQHLERSRCCLILFFVKGDLCAGDSCCIKKQRKERKSNGWKGRWYGCARSTVFYFPQDLCNNTDGSGLNISVPWGL